jgi:lipopolysaccharide transport system ATP-binding protein
MSSDIAIKVDNISKCYQIYENPRDRLLQGIMPRLQRLVGRPPKQYCRDFWALKNASFEVKKGETVGIIGRNGSGKSTLLQMVCGTLTPTSGNITTNGRVAALLELGAGFNPEFTGRENVYMNASILGLSKEKIDERFDKISAFADIGTFIEQPVKTYSSGMYVRLAFAVIAHVDADILVVDEALSVGDAFFTQKCMRFMRKFMEHGTVLFVSHDTAAVINLCDQAIWIDKGQPQMLGPSKIVCEEYLNNLFADMNHEYCELPEKKEAIKISRVGQLDLAWRDQRTDFINDSGLRNDLEVFKFRQEDSSEFGGKEAKIVNVFLADSTGSALHWVVGGERVLLIIEAETYIPLHSPIVGFFVKDRLGQTLFGDNTFLSYAYRPCSVQAGESVKAEFEFFMPWLPQGDYCIQVALAEGSQEVHRQLHWLHDALIFKSHHSPVTTGIIGIPINSIKLICSGE